MAGERSARMAALGRKLGARVAAVKGGPNDGTGALRFADAASRTIGMTRTIAAALACVAAASPVVAEPVTALISAVTPVDGGATVDIVFLNTGGAAIRFDPPPRLTADLAAGSARGAVVLERAEAVAPVSLAAGGFVRRRYTAPIAGGSAAVLTLAGGAAFAVAPVAAPVAAAGVVPAVVEKSLNSAQPDTGNAFLGNLSAYAPIYAVYGPDTNSDARIQISFKYQLLGAPGGRTSWLDGFNLAYTQRLYWNLGAKSSPFRNVDYNPELIYIVPAPVTRGGIAFGGQAGVAHLSNGRDGDASRSFNTIYVEPTATIPIGDYSLTVGPRLLAYVGSLSDNPDIARYRGRSQLFAQIGRDDGWRLSTTSRINFGSGKGAINAELSYPLDRLVGVKLYAFGQAFAGYGENLLDYDRKQTRVRVGLGFVR